jgi:hopene-associated glycosyltransferase HpnB
VSLSAWVGLLVWPARPWDLRPVAEDQPPFAAPPDWPEVCAIVPARNEAALLPETLPRLLGQDYPGPLRVVVVDDRSADGTGEIARDLGAELVTGSELPSGWVGKACALEQGLAHAGSARYLLLTDADVRHVAGSARSLVAEAEADDLALVSRMVRLRCESQAERLLVPAFLFFFNCLYPMRLANDPRRRLAAAAGGCILVSRHGLDRAGGFHPLRGAEIDDVALARAVKRSGGRIRLAVSRRDVESLRAHETVRSFWRTIRRTAFAQLGRSHALLVATLAGLAGLFAAPPLALALGLAALDPVPAALGVAAWIASAAAYLPSVRFFGLPAARALLLPAAGLLYAGMTLDSGARDGRLHW